MNVTLCQTSTPYLVTGTKLKPGQATEHSTVYTGFLQDQGKGRPATLVRSLDIRRPYTSPIYYNQENEQVSKVKREKGNVVITQVV